MIKNTVKERLTRSRIRKKTLAKALDISVPTLNKRIDDNDWTLNQAQVLVELGLMGKNIIRIKDENIEAE